MRMLDKATDRAIKRLVLMLTVQEASDLKAEIEELLASGRQLDHGHVNDESYTHEVTVALYEPDRLAGLAQRIRTLILEDE